MSLQDIGMPDRRMLLKSGTSIGLAAVTGAFAGAVEKAGEESGGVANVPDRMPKRALGFMLPHEQFDLRQRVDFGVAAEDAGFDFVALSDHFQPWQNNEGHARNVVGDVTMAALGMKTKRIRMGTTVNRPTYRYTPAVVAEGFASLSILHPNRIFLGFGSGEALN